MENLIIISLGGSLIAPAGVADSFLISFRNLIKEELAKNKERKIILICGGGATAREYQRAFFSINPDASPEQADTIGIVATRLNAELVRQVFYPLCQTEVVTNPEAEINFKDQLLIACGWRPGFSTDYVAVCLAERFKAKLILNLSNISKVYTSDPKKDHSAKPLAKIDWKTFQEIIGEKWTPGQNVPFDPIASQKAKELGLKVIIASGSDLANLKAILDNRDFSGTTIMP